MDNKCIFALLILLFKVYILLNALISQSVSEKVCDARYFGQDCKLLCHCYKSKCCGVNNGECPPGDKCDTGYFGPGCQYVELVSLETINVSVPIFIHDSNDSTCNPNPTATSVQVIQRNAYPFSWFRIVVNNKTNLLSFTTTLNNGLACSNERKFKVSDTIVDVTCDVTLNLKKLTIDGPIVGSICSVYISGGRNTAVRQETNQTGVYAGHTSDRAVDGYRDARLNDKHCAHPANITPSPWWLITFNRPQIMYYVGLYNRDDLQERLNGFNLQTFDHNLKLVASYEDKSSGKTSVYMVNVNSQTQVTSLKITQNSTQKNVLTLCEVETYGEHVCPPDYYGFNCQRACLCNRTERCSVVTGACAPGCPTGYYGFNCVSRCSVNCLQGICEWMTGNCFPCKPGYIGDMCTIACSPGYFGDRCKFMCSEGCFTKCDVRNGTCACSRKFKGPTCTVCADEFYGAHCAEICPIRCVDQQCDGITGKCHSCVEGYTGDYCDQETWSAWLLIVVLVVLLLWLFFYLEKRRSERNGAEEGGI